MGSQPLLSQVQIPEDELRTALQSVAIPGYTGSMVVEIGLREEVAQFIVMAVLRQQSKSVGEHRVVKQTIPDPDRRRPVDKVLADLRPKLFIRPVLLAVEAHYLDGILQRFIIRE